VILIGLGANLTNKDGVTPAESLKRAVQALQSYQDINVLAGSSIWKSAPVPISDQPWYYNAVCQIETQLLAPKLLGVVAAIEDEAGRVRSVRNAARVLDIDILAYNQDIIQSAELEIPHPRMHERAFVLFPLREIAPKWIHPKTGESIDDMIAKLDPAQEIEQTEVRLMNECV